MTGDFVVSLLGALVFVAVCGATLALGIYLYIRIKRDAQRKRAWAIALATQYGFRIDPDEKGPPPHRFDVFSDGHSKRVTNQIWRDGSPNSVFDYTYTTGQGDSRTTHRRTCALIALRFAAPHTKIATENFFSTLGRRLGIRDIETESVRFNEIYRISSDDERFAINLLDSRAMDWLLDRTPNGPGSITFEFWGPWLVCVSSRMPTQDQFGFLDWAQSVPSWFPTVLDSLYPVTHPTPGATR
ncbi:MAG: hypothetical protein AB8G14_15770 [Ilumatobacter sp.]